MHKKMKVLVIGKNGQLGLSLCDEATKNKIPCIATDRFTLDISDEKSVQNYFLHNNDFDFIINATGYTNVDGAEKNSEAARAVNCCAMQYLAHAAKVYGIPIIHISTDYVFDGQKKMSYCETDSTNPINIYGKTKVDGENILKSIYEKHIILRVSWLFSEYGKNFLKTIVKLCDQPGPLSVVCDQFGSPTSARSLAKVILKICNILHTTENNHDYFGTYHYTDFPETNWYQFACYIAAAKKEKAGTTKIISPIESKDYPMIAKRPKNSVLNIEKIKMVFNIKPSLWAHEVDRMIKIL